MADLIKEQWLAVIAHQYSEGIDWISKSRDLSGAVVNGKILHWAKAGARPTVLRNNTTWPMSMGAIIDTAESVDLDRFNTTPTLVHDYEEFERAYDKMASDTEEHKVALQEEYGYRCAFNWAPTSFGLGTPVIQCSGAALPSGRIPLKLSDVIKLRNGFDTARVPQQGRVLMLSADHAMDIATEDLARASHTVDPKTGALTTLYGFEVIISNYTPVWDSSAGEKAPYGTTETTDFWRCSLAWQVESVARADGDWKMFVTPDDSRLAGTSISFQKYQMGFQFRETGFGVLYS
jgi:hypothetical protein